MQRISWAGILVILVVFCALGHAKPVEKQSLRFKPCVSSSTYSLECKRVLKTKTTLGNNTETLEENTVFYCEWTLSTTEHEGNLCHTFQPARLAITNNAGSDQETLMTVTADTMELKRGEKIVRKDATRNTPYAGFDKWRAKRVISPIGAPTGEEPQLLGEQAALSELFPLIMPDWVRLPDNAVKIGDTWSGDCFFMNIDKEDPIAAFITTSFELEGFDVQDGHQLARIGFKAGLNDKKPIDVLETDGVKIELSNIRQEVTGYFDFDLNDGIVLLMEATAETAVDYKKTLTQTSLPASTKNRSAVLEFKWQLEPNNKMPQD